jgi:hypothetical protein
MRNYQTLTLIGAILTILIVLAVALIFSTLGVIHYSFGNFTQKYGSESTIRQYSQTSQSVASGAAFLSAAIPISVFASIASIVLVFVIKQKLKALGIILIILGVIIVIATSAYGIVGFVLLIVAGVLALRAKPVMELKK